MGESRLEPGLIRVFRWYAWLRSVFLAFIPAIIIHPGFKRDLSIENIIQMLVIVFDVLVLLVYLYFPGLEKKLGKYYFPLAILIAAASLLLEQYVVIASYTGWHQYPFMFVLLILVAWQYRFREVVIFTLGVALVEFAFLMVLPTNTTTYRLVPQEFQRMVSLSFMFSRAVVFLVVGYVVTALMNAQRQQRRALGEANQKLVQHASTLEQLAVSRERIRLSRELHDTLAHTLSALTVQIEALQTVWEPIPDKPRQMLSDMLDTTRSGLDETRRSLTALRASPLEEMGLALAVRTLAEEYASRYAFDLEMEIPDNFDDLPPDVEQCYYRVAQEALANIARHAYASLVSLRLHNETNGLLLEIKDDGKGFRVLAVDENYNGKFGIRGMHERAELIGANLQIESRIGEGTTLRLYWRKDDGTRLHM